MSEGATVAAGFFVRVFRNSKSTPKIMLTWGIRYSAMVHLPREGRKC